MLNTKDNKTLVGNILSDHRVKIGLYIAGALASVYLIGIIFRIVAHATDGYNQMQAAFKNGGSGGPAIKK